MDGKRREKLYCTVEEQEEEQKMKETRTPAREKYLTSCHPFFVVRLPFA